MDATKMKEKYDSLSNTSKYVGYGSVFLLFIALYAYIQGKKDGNSHVPLPENTNSSETEAQSIRSLSLALYNEMKGVGLNSSIEPFKRYLAASDRIFIAVYNDYNSMYQDKGSVLDIFGKSTLRDWINSEYWGMQEYWGGTTVDSQVKNSIITRMNTLNLQ